MQSPLKRELEKCSMNQEYDNYDEMREARRRRQIMRARRERRRKRMIRAYTILAVCAVILILLIVGAVKLVSGLFAGDRADGENLSASGTQVVMTEAMTGGKPETMPQTVMGTTLESITPGGNSAEEGFQKPVKTYSAERTADTQTMNDEVHSSYGIFLNRRTGAILAERNSSTIINPASMTKILTVLVAAEALESQKALDETFKITREITEYSYVNDCSNAGFETDEVVTVRDLFYGTILPSGGEAAAALAIYTAGSLDAFVEQMNEKLDQLGLSGTAHFTNCVGLYDEAHRCTVYDMAMILQAALDNSLCREVLSAKTYTTSATDKHPEGIELSNWFLRRIEDKDTGGRVISGKTGYEAQSGNCPASFGMDRMGKEYICVTADAYSGWRCIYDHVALYKQFAKE